MLFDSHCHWDHPDLQALQPGLWQSCEANKVNSLLVPGTVAKAWQQQVDLCAAHEHWHLALGLHPYFLDQHHSEDLSLLQQFVDQHKPVAIGEIGLDWHLPQDSWAAQESLLFDQLQLAKEYQLPVILHVRKCHDRVIKILRQQKYYHGGFVHAYGGNAQQAKAYADMGFKMGVGGTITYERAKKIRAMVSELPLEWLVLETDAPYMPMNHQQGDLNRPDDLPKVVDALAEMRAESAQQIAEQTYLNTCEVLGLK